MGWRPQLTPPLGPFRIRISPRTCLCFRAFVNPSSNPASRRGARQVPTGTEWIHEIKHDGYRLIVERDGKRVRYGPAIATTGAVAFPLITKAACATAIRPS